MLLKNIKQLYITTIFLLKSVYFSPVNNPAVYILFFSSALLFFGGDFGKHETILLLIITALSNRFIPSFKRHSSSINESVLSQSFQLLPVNKNIIKSSLFISMTIYALLLMTVIYNFGAKSETPPMIPSLCPQKLCTYKNPTGEYHSYIEGLTLRTNLSNNLEVNLFKIPINQSLLFDNIAGELIFKYGEVKDEKFKSFKTELNHTNTGLDILAGESNESFKSRYYSPFLFQLYNKQNHYLKIFAALFFTIFLIDGIIFHSLNKRSKFKTILNSFFYITISSISLILIMEIFLPSDLLNKLFTFLIFIRQFKTFFLYTFILLAIIRIVLFFNNPKRDKS